MNSWENFLSGIEDVDKTLIQQAEGWACIIRTVPSRQRQQRSKQSKEEKSRVAGAGGPGNTGLNEVRAMGMAHSPEGSQGEGHG